MKLTSVFYQGFVMFLVRNVHIFGVHLVLENHMSYLQYSYTGRLRIAHVKKNLKRIDCPASAQRKKLFGENDSESFCHETPFSDSH